jgi:hypothetical protein
LDEASMTEFPDWQLTRRALLEAGVAAAVLGGAGEDAFAESVSPESGPLDALSIPVSFVVNGQSASLSLDC